MTGIRRRNEKSEVIETEDCMKWRNRVGSIFKCRYKEKKFVPVLITV